jgi:hypothetical protein
MKKPYAQNLGGKPKLLLFGWQKRKRLHSGRFFGELRPVQIHHHGALALWMLSEPLWVV